MLIMVIVASGLSGFYSVLWQSVKCTVNPNSHRVGHIGPTLFWRQITKKNIKYKIFLKLS
jgi:hypothetical protein